jgi:hypothetical protein
LTPWKGENDIPSHNGSSSWIANSSNGNLALIEFKMGTLDVLAPSL